MARPLLRFEVAESISFLSFSCFWATFWVSTLAVPPALAEDRAAPENPLLGRGGAERRGFGTFLDLSPLARGTPRSLRQGVPRECSDPLVVPLRKGDKMSHLWSGGEAFSSLHHLRRRGFSREPPMPHCGTPIEDENIRGGVRAVRP